MDGADEDFAFLHNGEGGTIAAILTLDSGTSGTLAQIIANCNGTSETGFGLLYDDRVADEDNLVGYGRPSTGGVSEASDNNCGLDDYKQHSIVVVFDDLKMLFYVDGVLHSEETASAWGNVGSASQALTLFASPNGNNVLSGELTEVRVTKSKWTATVAKKYHDDYSGI